MTALASVQTHQVRRSFPTQGRGARFPRVSTVRHAIAGIAQIDRTRITWRPALRASLVILVLITSFTLTGRPLEAVPVTVGALFAAIADAGEPIGRRWRTMLWTTGWLMLAGLVGEVVSDTPVLILIVSVIFAAACGFAGALGQRAALAGTLALVTLTIFAGLPEHAPALIPNALLIGLGGVVQTAVTCLPPLIRRPSDRFAVADAESVVTRLRSALNPQDPFARHAVRLALAILVSTAISLVWQTPHSYWIPMTVAWIAKPDQNGTIDKVLGRIAGTIIGLLLVAVAIDVLHLGDVAMLLSVVVGSVLVLSFVWANYALAVTGVTIFVAALFAPVFDAAVGSTIWLRVLDTLIAGAITVLASFVWKAPATHAE